MQSSRSSSPLNAIEPWQGQTVVVAVSGGVDSVALLHMLLAVWPRDQLVIAHVDHGVRDDSAENGTFVARLALQYGIAYAIERLELNADTFSEARGRTLRYQFLARVAHEQGAPVVVSGHHADDQAETVLLHLLRGSGPDGLAAMRATAPLPTDPTVTLVRPLLNVRKAALVAYCEAHDLRWREDATNSDTTYLRNRVRHELLPLLEEMNGGMVDRLGQLAAVVAAETGFLDAFTDETLGRLTSGGAGWLKIERDAWQSLPLALRRRSLRLWATVHQLDLSFDTLETARKLAETGTVGERAPLSADHWLQVDYDVIWLLADGVEPPRLGPQVEGEMRLEAGSWVALGAGWRLSVVALDDTNDGYAKDAWSATVALETNARLLVRGRRAGEQLQPLGMNGQHKSLQDVMVDRKISAELRDRWPIVATDEHPVWVVGHLLDERAKLHGDNNGKQLLELRCEQVGE